MKIRQRAIRTAAAGTAVAAVTFAVAAVGTAEASSSDGAAAKSPATRGAAQPAFLSGEELPPHPSSPWYEGAVTGGLPEVPVFCLEEALPEQGAAHRTYRTEYDTSAVQVTVRAETVRAARDLAAQAEESVRGCAAAYEEQFPGSVAELRDLGAVDVQEGAHVYGVDTANPEGPSDVHLFGIGRDGRTVTVVDWGQMGDFDHAPVEDFRTTTRTAVEKLRS